MKKINKWGNPLFLFFKYAILVISVEGDITPELGKKLSKARPYSEVEPNK